MRAVLLADVVAASAAVGATRSRTAKAAALAALLRAAEPDEVEPVTAWLAGRAAAGPARRRLAHPGRRCDIDPAPAPSLTVAAVDAALDELAGTSGAGSAGAGATPLLAGLFGAATADEQAFLAGCSPASCARARWRA